MENEYLYAFTKDYEKLLRLSINMDKYDLESHCIILRKYLLDQTNITDIWKYMGHSNPMNFRCMGQDNKIEGELLDSTYLYINFLNCFESKARIFDFGVIQSRFFEKHGFSVNSPSFPSNKEAYLNLNNFISNDYIIVDSVYFRRVDIINFICYVRGHAHISFTDPRKQHINDITKISLKNDYYGTDKGVVYNLSEEDEFNHPVDSVIVDKEYDFLPLLLLQIIYDFKYSPDVYKLYKDVKDYLNKI